MDLLDRMVLPPGVRLVASALASHGFDAVLVGGAVRDAILGEASTDWDLVTDAEPAVVRSLANGIGGIRGVYDLGERFGTLGIALEGEQRLEVTRYRPDALAGNSVAERFAVDAGHRDFTVNAIGIDLESGTLLDPQGGVADIESGVLRSGGSAENRFREDPIRVLRAARFVAELGFELGSETAAALGDFSALLDGIARERVREELTKLLTGDYVERGLAVLRESGALAVLLPEVSALDGVTQPSFHDLDVLAHTIQTVSLAPPQPVLRWAGLLHDVGKAPMRTVEPDGRIRFFGHAKTGARMAEQICRRLRMSAADTSAIVHLVAEHMRLGDVNPDNPRSVDRAVRKLDLWTGSGEGARRIVGAEEAVSLTVADLGATAHRAEAPEALRLLSRAVHESRARGTLSQVESPVSGDEIMAELGLSEGPLVGMAKRAVEAAIADGSIAADDRAAALLVARAALNEHS